MKYKACLAALTAVTAAALLPSPDIHGEWNFPGDWRLPPPPIPQDPETWSWGICPVRINEVMVNADDEFRDEFIELYNTSRYPVDISKWTITDNGDTDRIVDYHGRGDFGEPGTVIPPYGYALIVDGDYDGYYWWCMSEDLDFTDRWIIVRVDDDAIGNGLANNRDFIRIRTDWLGGRIWDGVIYLQYLYLSWDEGDELGVPDYNGVSWEYDTREMSWEHSCHDCGSTPATYNSHPCP